MRGKEKITSCLIIEDFDRANYILTVTGWTENDPFHAVLFWKKTITKVWTIYQLKPTANLTVEKANKLDHLADYLDLTFIIDSGGKLSTRLCDKRDDFDFHIVNFPYLSSNIPSGPSYGVYISQLIRYARCCSHYDDFRYRYKCLVDRLLSQGYIAVRLEKSFKKFYGRYQDLIEKYQRLVNVIHFQDNFYLTWNRNLVFILLFTWICCLDLSLGFV